MRALISIFLRELLLHYAKRSEWLSVIIFYVICSTLFPIAAGGWGQDFTWFSPIIIWIAAIITIVLAQETLMREDFKLGVFDVMVLSGHPLSLLLMLKILAHWCIYSLPIVLITPIIGISLGLKLPAIFIVSGSLFLGSIFLSFIAAIGAAITVMLARGGTLLALLLLPLYVPVLCLGSSVGILSVHGVFSIGHFALLAALAIGALFLVPVVTAIAVKVNME